MIKISNLQFGYFDTEVLKGLNIEVKEDEILVLLGPNGSGKTTLLKILSKILKPKFGEVSILGKDINKYSISELARIVASVPQIHKQTFPYTVLDIVLSGRNPQLETLKPSKKDLEVALKVLEELSILHLKDRPYTNISGGELRLVLIARALAQEAKILLLDEPTAFLDFKNSNLILNKIIELRDKRHITFIITLHDPNEALRIGDRVALLKKGEIVDIGKPFEVINEKNLRKVYNIDVERVEIDGKVFIYAK